MSGVHAVVLAAGRGLRFGGGKLMTPWRGGVLLDGALEAASAAPVDSVRVVTGEDVGVADHLRARGIEAVHAARAAEGLSESLKAGLASLPDGASGAMILLGDMPFIPHDVLPPLIEALGRARAAAPVFEGRLGHPVVISAALFSAVRALSGDRGARSVITALGDDLAQIPTSNEGVLIDIDRPADLDVRRGGRPGSAA